MEKQALVNNDGQKTVEIVKKFVKNLKTVKNVKEVVNIFFRQKV